jgi:ATP-dependent helicase HrpA
VGARAFYVVDSVPRDAESFEAQRLAGRKHILPAVQEVTRLVQALFEAYHELRLTLESQTRRPTTWKYALDDVQEQLAALLKDGFLTITPWEWLQHFPRYLKAMNLRLKKITSAVLRDKQLYEQAAKHWEQYKERFASHKKRFIDDPELEAYRWMIEELRVSLFAQELGTSAPVSPQRLDKQWAKVRV